MQGEYSKKVDINKLPSLVEAMVPKQLEVYDQVKGEVKFVKICSGYSHQAALDTQGRLYTWGDCTDGALGHQFNKGKEYII